MRCELGRLAGWQYTLSRPDGKIQPITQTTDGSGKTTFKNLIPGVYNVKETVQPGWELQMRTTRSRSCCGTVKTPL